MRFAWPTISLPATLGCAVRKFRRDQRGSVATIMGFTALPLVMAVGMGVEVTCWTVVKLRLQRMADTAALAGALEYQAGNNPRNATNAAANLAELNGASGSATRTSNATTKLLVDNQVTVQVVAGVRSPTNTEVVPAGWTVWRPS